MGRTKKSFDISLQREHELITEPIEVANEFNKYFSSIADNIRGSIPSATKDFKEFYRETGLQDRFIFNRRVYTKRDPY